MKKNRINRSLAAHGWKEYQNLNLDPSVLRSYGENIKEPDYQKIK